MKRIVCILTLVLPLLASAQAQADTTEVQYDPPVEEIIEPPEGFDQPYDPADTRIPRSDKFQKVDAQPMALNMDTFFKCLDYPKPLIKKKVEGMVYIKVLVNDKGEPLEHIVVKTPHPDFVEQVAKCLYKLRFSPALVNGKPLKFFWVLVPVEFKL